MEDSSQNHNKNIFNDNFITNWLPNSETMLQMTFNNKEFVYYPSTLDRDNIKVFDITSQRGNTDAEDEFVAIDQKTGVTTSKQKQKPQQQIQLNNLF